MKAAVVTISDRASRGEYEDLSGPEIVSILCEHFGDGIEISTAVIPDETDAILAALDAAAASGADAVLTTGGTGLSPRDVTPEATAAWCEKELPGIAELLRRESYQETPMAALSRGYAGVRGATVAINFPGSLKAVRLCTRLVLPLLAHAPAMIAGEGH